MVNLVFRIIDALHLFNVGPSRLILSPNNHRLGGLLHTRYNRKLKD
jgi:hypothetical protein